jgi:hypothetical protein
VIIDAIESLANGGVGFSQPEESVIAQTPQNAGLGKTDSVLCPSGVAAVPEEHRRHNGRPSCRNRG